MPHPVIRYDTDFATKFMYLCRDLHLDKYSAAELLDIKRASNINALWRGLDRIRPGVMERLEAIDQDIDEEVKTRAAALRVQHWAKDLLVSIIYRYDTSDDYHRLARPEMVARWPVVALHHCFTQRLARQLNLLGVFTMFKISLGEFSKAND